jgi:glycosyltransferase involved in cell wall biosynthesis
VIPVYNETESLPLLHEELVSSIEKLSLDYEIIYVDDGSVDDSFITLEQIYQKWKNIVRVIRFRKNFGQTAAISAGFDYAKGDVIISMDADMQNDPRDIPLLLEKIDEGYDLVNGWRHDRKDTFINRRLPSIIANKIISYTTNVKLHDYGCTLKAFKKDVVKNIKLYGELHRFIPAIASYYGVSIAEVKVNHRPRRFGKAKYGISRTIKVILDLITVKFLLSYSTRPIQIFGLLGFYSGGLGFLIALYLTFMRQLYGIPMGNRPILQLAILLIFMGLQFISIGLIAELQARTYHETQNKSIYSIKKILAKDD